MANQRGRRRESRGEGSGRDGGGGGGARARREWPIRRFYNPPRLLGDTPTSAAARRQGASEGPPSIPSPPLSPISTRPIAAQRRGANGRITPPTSPNVNTVTVASQPTAVAATPNPLINISQELSASQSQKEPAIKRKASGSSPEQKKRSNFHLV